MSSRVATEACDVSTMMRDVRAVCVLCLLGVAACGDDGGHKSPDAAERVDAPAHGDASGSDAPGSDAPVATVTLDLGAGVSGNDLHWMANQGTLYFDRYVAGPPNTGTISKWTEAAGVVDVQTTTNSDAQFQLSGITPIMGGNVVALQFWNGSADSAYYMDAAGTYLTSVTGMNNGFKRIGVASAMGNTYEVRFQGGGGGTVTGGVAKLAFTVDNTTTPPTVAAVETPLVTTQVFGKLVGIVVSGTDVYVSEQNKPANTSAIYKIDTANNNAVTTVVANLPCADLLTMLPNGDLLTSTGGSCTGTTNHIARVTQAGAVTLLDLPGLDTVSGIAYDATGHRLFVENHPATGNDSIQIVPVTL